MAQYPGVDAQPGIANNPQEAPQASPPPKTVGTHADHPSQPQAPQSQLNQHKRVYQACIPCRRRKVRCDLGSVDDPHDPPCVRCRRESKECFFSATRRKRKADDDSEDHDIDDYIIRNGRKRVNASGSPPVQHLDPRYYSELPLTPGGSTGRSQPLRRPDSASRSNRRRGGDETLGAGDEPNAQVENLEAQTVMRRGVFGPHDALDLLYKAATDR